MIVGNNKNMLEREDSISDKLFISEIDQGININIIV